MLGRWALAASLLALVVGACAGIAAADGNGRSIAYRNLPVALGTTPAELPETSGIVASRTHPGVFWLENDSASAPDLFAVDETGALLATIHVAGATNVDWEDLTIVADESGDRDVLYIADTGDNAAGDTDGSTGRAGIVLYRLAEPDPQLGDQTVTAERIDLAYPDRPYDCEAVFADHATGDLYFITKEASPAEIFVARAPLTPATPITLEHVGEIDLSFATAADMARDQTQIVVRGYDTVLVFPYATSVAVTLGSPDSVTATPASSAEAICFGGAGYDLYTISEGIGATLYRIGVE